MPTKYELEGREPRKNKKTKYKYRDPYRLRRESNCAKCYLCKCWLRRGRWRIGVCEECENNARDPMYVKYARDYFNDPKFYQRLLMTIEILDSVHSMIEQDKEFKLMVYESTRRNDAKG